MKADSSRRNPMKAEEGHKLNSERKGRFGAPYFFASLQPHRIRVNLRLLAVPHLISAYSEYSAVLDSGRFVGGHSSN
jgi:hypothetical protein